MNEKHGSPNPSLSTEFEEGEWVLLSLEPGCNFLIISGTHLASFCSGYTKTGVDIFLVFPQEDKYLVLVEGGACSSVAFWLTCQLKF